MDSYIISLIAILATVYFLYVAATPPAAAAKKELAGIKWEEGIILLSRYMIHILG
jgi:hypothetical protein